MRDMARRVIRRVGVETGGANIQFARQPARRPRRGDRDEPAGLALQRAGQQGDGLPHRQDRRQAGGGLHPRRDRQRHHPETPASFEPALDYVVVKVPRFAFKKFPGAPRHARHPDALGRRGDGHRPHLRRRRCRRRCARWRSGAPGWAPTARTSSTPDRAARAAGHAAPGAALLGPRARWRAGLAVEEVARGHAASIRWFLRADRARCSSSSGELAAAPRPLAAPLLRAGQAGGLLRPPARPPHRRHRGAEVARAAARRWACVPTYKTIDTCAAEFAAPTPYYYSTYEDEDELARLGRGRRQVMILGGGPEPHRPGDRVRLLLRARRGRRCARWATRRSWSTATRRPSRPTTTSRTGSTSSR